MLMTEQRFHKLKGELDEMPDLPTRTSVITDRTREKVKMYMRAGVCTDQCLCRKFGLFAMFVVRLREEMLGD